MEIQVISGFLGAGKTTFLNQYLPVLKGKTVVIENEFGDVGLDGELIQEDVPVREIYAGCICCSLALDFRKGIKELKEQGIQLKELKGLIPDMLRTRDKLKLQKEPKEDPTVSNSVSEEQLDMASNASLEKIQLQIEEIFQHAMLENNKILEESVSQSISQAIIKEMNYLFQAQDRQEEDRYKKLDHLIRQQQTYRKESARSAPIRKLRKLFEM